MWFRNLQLYTLSKPIDLAEDQWQEKLEAQAFTPCRGLDTHQTGWTPPLGKHGDLLFHQTDGCRMLCMRREDRLLPAAVIREALDEKVDIIEQQEARKVGRKEKSSIRDDITVDLLPRAFTRSQRCYAYIDPKNNLILVDSSSANRAEECLSLLRESLGSLPVKPLTVNQSPAAILTDWVMKKPPDELLLGEECELKEPMEKGAVIKAKHLPPQSSDIQQHIKAGMQVSRLAITWQGRISVWLGDDLAIRRMKFLDLIMDEMGDLDLEDEATRFDADFSIMSRELATFIPQLTNFFGGINLD